MDTDNDLQTTRDVRVVRLIKLDLEQLLLLRNGIQKFAAVRNAMKDITGRDAMVPMHLRISQIVYLNIDDPLIALSHTETE